MWDNYNFFFFFFFEKHTHTHTTLLKSHDNFLLLIFVDCNNIDSVHCEYGVKEYCIYCNIIIENCSLVQHTS